MELTCIWILNMVRATVKGASPLIIEPWHGTKGLSWRINTNSKWLSYMQSLSHGISIGYASHYMPWSLDRWLHDSTDGGVVGPCDHDPPNIYCHPNRMTKTRAQSDILATFAKISGVNCGYSKFNRVFLGQLGKKIQLVITFTREILLERFFFWFCVFWEFQSQWYRFQSQHSSSSGNFLVENLGEPSGLRECWSCIGLWLTIGGELKAIIDCFLCSELISIAYFSCFGFLITL